MIKAVMTRYDAYKDSGVEWICKIPMNWTITRIKDITLVKRGASPRPIDDPIYFDEEGEFSWVRIADLSASERYLLFTKEKLSALGASLSVKRYPGDFILSIAGTVGKPIITKIKCCIHDGFVWFPNLKFNSEFLYYCFSTGLPYQGLGKLGTQLNLNTETVGLISLPIPSDEELTNVICYLDTRTAQIDRKINLLTQKATQYGKLKQSLINETVTRGLDKTVAMKDSGVEWIGDIPIQWEVTRNKDIFEERGNLSHSGNETLLTVSHITGVTRRTEKNVNMFMAETMEGYKLCEKGDLVINTMWAWMGALGTCNENGICSPAYGVYKPKKDKPYNHKYFDYLYRTPNSITEMTKNSKGIVSSRLRLYPKEFFQIKTALPNCVEQKAIADYLDEKTAHIDRIAETINIQIDKLRELRKTLINDVVTGKIKVS